MCLEFPNFLGAGILHVFTLTHSSVTDREQDKVVDALGTTELCFVTEWLPLLGVLKELPEALRGVSGRAETKAQDQ